MVFSSWRRLIVGLLGANTGWPFVGGHQEYSKLERNVRLEIKVVIMALGCQCPLLAKSGL